MAESRDPSAIPGGKLVAAAEALGLGNPDTIHSVEFTYDTVSVKRAVLDGDGRIADFATTVIPVDWERGRGLPKETAVGDRVEIRDSAVDDEEPR